MITDLRTLGTQLDHSKSLNGEYPTTQQGLRVLGNTPKDKWSKDYFFRCPGKRYPNGCDLFSVGPDRVADITNTMI